MFEVDHAPYTSSQDVQNGQPSSPAQPRRAETHLDPGKAAGESKPEAYPLGYVEDFDEPRTKLEAVFNIRLVLENLRFRVRRLRTNLRLRISLIKEQQVSHRNHPDNLTLLCHAQMPHS
jgi:hypothetical protein